MCTHTHTRTRCTFPKNGDNTYKLPNTSFIIVFDSAATDRILWHFSIGYPYALRDQKGATDWLATNEQNTQNAVETFELVE